MTEHLVIRTSLLVALIRLTQAVVPPAMVVGTLYCLATLLDVPFDEAYVSLAIIAATLTAVLVRPGRSTGLDIQKSKTGLGIDILVGWGLVVSILLALGFSIGVSDYFSRRVLLPWAFVSPMTMWAGSVVVQRLMRKTILSLSNQRKVIIAGVNEAGLQLARNINEHPELCMRLMGFFDDRSQERLGSSDEAKLLGRLSDLAEYTRANNIDVIYVALPIRHVQRVMDLLDELRDTTISIYFVPDIFVYDLIQSRTTDIWGMPVVALCETPFFGYRGITKRLLDITLTLIALVPLLPVMGVIAAIIKMTSPGPAIFRQTRYGLDGEEIVVFKFRSMYVTEDGPHIPQAKKNDPRITPIGHFIRKYSLDELPQLFNVLQGRMSLVGPRPHAVAHNEQYRHVIKGYMIRHKVLPGITGLAQINGCRGETSEVSQMQARVEYDLDYLRQWTPVLDIKILLTTAIQIFHDPNAY